MIKEYRTKDLDFDAWTWAVKAISKNANRIALCNALVENGELIACDGKRLHIAKLKLATPDGQYKVLRHSKTRVEVESVENPSPYPNWRQVWPSEEPAPLKVSFYPSDEPEQIYAQLVRALPHAPAFNFKFLSDALPSEVLELGQAEYCTPLIGRSTDGAYRFALMPMRP